LSIIFHFSLFWAAKDIGGWNIGGGGGGGVKPKLTAVVVGDIPLTNVLCCQRKK
jgi:hypothetical protein